MHDGNKKYSVYIPDINAKVFKLLLNKLRADFELSSFVY